MNAFTKNHGDYNLSHFVNNTGDDLFDIVHHYYAWLEVSKKQGYQLYLDYANTSPSTRIEINGYTTSPMINLASYNYLGLSYRPEVIQAAVSAVEYYGLGASGSPLLSGSLDIHEMLKTELAAFKQAESVLLFPSGYSANVGTISALVGKNDTVIIDRYAHASIIDGCIMARANVKLFRHNDMNSLELYLSKTHGRKLVIVEGVYSMDGDMAPIPEVVELCQRYGARLMVDEAHSAFVCGEHGRGVAEKFGVEDAIDIRLGTMSKSLGGMGGYVVASKKLTEYLFAYARAQLFSCAMSPVVAGGLIAALRIVKKEPELREKLWNNVAIMRQALLESGVNMGTSTTQIIPVIVKKKDNIFDITKDLLQAGVYLNPVIYPAVNLNEPRLRIAISAAHEPSELNRAAALIADVLRKHKII